MSTSDPSIKPHAHALQQNLARALWLATGMSVIFAALIIWSVRGERIFSDLVSTTLAWCF